MSDSIVEPLIGIAGIGIAGTALLGGAAIMLGVPYHWWVHDKRAEVTYSKDLSQVEKKPFNHWFCLNCYFENRHAKTFETSVLKPDITRVTVKPVSCSSDHTYHYGKDYPDIQQVVLETPQGKRVRYIPKSHNEVTVETPKGKETFDLRAPLAPGVKIATAPAPIVNGTNTLAAAAQNTRE